MDSIKYFHEIASKLTRANRLVVNFSCLVVKKEHLIVILTNLVVKITTLVVIVK